MSSAPLSLEEIVAAYLDERDEQPELRPEDYAARYPDRADRILEAIESTLQVLHAVNDAAPPEQKRIGSFRILREIGRGGMGIVYEAERSGRHYALKLMPFAPLSSPRAIERFRREIEVLERLDHRNIVGIVESGVQDGTPFIVMELVDGDPVAHLAGTDSPPERIAEIVRTLALAVQSAHDRNVLHRDIKPQNVMLRRDGSPVLLDFGLMAADDLPGLTSTGDMVGTPRYMPSERIRGEAADARTDVYGIGMILYELLLGQPAYDQNSREMIIQAVTHGHFVRPRRIRPELDRGLEKIIVKAIATDARHRYDTAAELAKDLERYLAGQAVRARPPGPFAHVLSAVRRHPRRVALYGVMSIAMLGVGYGVIDTVQRDGTISEAQRSRAEALAARGTSLWLDERPDNARAQVEEAIAADPDQPTARALLAVLTEDSIADADPSSPASLLHDGIRQEKSRSTHEDAQRAFDRVLETDPTNPLALALLARIARDQDRIDDTEGYLRRVEVILPDCAAIHESLAWVYEKRDRYDTGILHCERAIELREDFAAAWALLAKLHARRGTLEQGLAIVERAKEIAGRREFLQVMNIEASMLDSDGRHDEAQRLFRKILEFEPESGLVWFNLGLSLDTDHKIIEAIDAYEKSIQYSDNERTRALLCLSHIYNGAQRGTCSKCDVFYAEHPEYLDKEQAFGFWKRAIVSDDGRESPAFRTLLGMSFGFPRVEVLEFLEEVSAREPDSPRSRRTQQIIRKVRTRGE